MLFLWIVGLTWIMLIGYGININLGGRFQSDGHMAVVYVDVNGIAQRGYLQQLHLVAGQAAHFQQL